MRREATLFVASLAALLTACGQLSSQPPKVADRHAHCDLASEKPEAITDAVTAEPIARELRAWAEDVRPNEPRDEGARFWATRLPCNEMVIAWRLGRGFCGSGGCSLFVWDGSDQRLRPLARVPVTWMPVRLLEGRVEGRPVLAAWTQGGGILQGYERPFRFDGTEYPMTTDWDLRVAPEAAGVALLSSSRAMDDGLPLYPAG
ncbi:MAG: hypothetical protein JNL35_04565 [Sphingopyxis sp.]|nr:hypothetical protein [Sphingopyxis sp.]